MVSPTNGLIWTINLLKTKVYGAGDSPAMSIVVYLLGTFNPLVTSSNLVRPTRDTEGLAVMVSPFSRLA